MSDATRPAPLVPADVDLRDFGFMPLDVLRLRDSDLAALSTGEEFKAAVMLWCVAWHQVPAGSLPNDDRLLARHSGAGAAWKKLRAEALRGFIECSDGRLYHVTICEKALDSWASKQAQRERTKAATLAREAKRREQQEQRDVERNVQRHVDRDGERDEQRESERHVVQGTGIGTVKGQGQGQGQGQGIVLAPSSPGASPPPPALVPAAEASATPRGSRLAEDWQLPMAWGDWALAEYAVWTPEKVRLEAAKFCDHWHAKAGKDGRKSDWFGTWRNWCRSDLAHRDDPKPVNARRGQATDAELAAANAAATAEARRQLFGDQEILDA